MFEKAKGHMTACMYVWGEFFDCPQIHFVTGIVDKAGDDSRVLISYGINDCVPMPRVVEVSKANIARLLVAPS